MDLGVDAREMEKVSARVRRDVEQEQQLRDQNRSLPGSLYNIHSPTMASVGSMPSLVTPQYGVAHRPAAPQHTVTHSAPHHMADQGVDLTQLHKLQSGMQKALREKQVVEHELQAVQNHLKQNQLEIKNTERQLKENRAKSEDVRTELMLAEFKRDSARKELEQVLDAIERSRQELEMMETAGEEDEAEETDGDKIDLTKQQISKLMAEREELRVKVKSLEIVSREKSELERQLATAKEELFQEQRATRQRMEGLKEELQSRETRLEDGNMEKDNMQKRIAKLESNYKQMEKDKNQLIKEKSQEYEQLKRQVAAQQEEARTTNSKEADELRQQLQQVSEQLGKAQSQINDRDQQCAELSQQASQLEERLSQEQKRHASLTQQQQVVINTLSKEKTEAVDAVQQQAETDRQTAEQRAESTRLQALEELRKQLSREHQQVLGHTQQQLKQQLTELYSQLTAREVELEVLRERVHSQEGATKQLGSKIRQEAQNKLHSLVEQERQVWERQREAELGQRVHSVRQEMQQTIQRLHEELASERAVIEQQVRQMTTMKQEVEDMKKEARLVQREKMSVLNQTRDSADQQRQRELDLLRQQYENETLKSVHKLEEMLRQKDEEIHRLRSERAQYQTEQQSQDTAAEKQEQSLISQINEECCLIGEANLRASGEDLRRHVHELKQELETQRRASNSVSKDSKQELSKLRQTMQQEKLKALEDLKDRLIKEHLGEVDKLHKSLGKGKSLSKALREKDSELREILRNMHKWKQQTTEKLAKKFQEEMSREMEKRVKEHKSAQREWQRDRAGHLRDIERLETEAHSSHMGQMNTSYGSPMRASHSAPPISSSPDPQTLRMVRELQNQVKQLQMENMGLKRSKISTSVPDLSQIGKTSYTEPPSIKLRQLELQLQQAETRIKTSEDRADKHEQLLNQKLVETSKLQSDLTHKTKELMEIERAYSKLQLQTKMGRPTVRSTAI